MSEEKRITLRDEEKARRDARLAEALRANLRRRKEAGKAPEKPETSPAEGADQPAVRGSLNQP